MCGIAGIVSLNGQVLDNEFIPKMTDIISHRGPDAEGFLITNAPDFCNRLKQQRPGALLVSKEHRQNVAFGHRRLSILDLSEAAAQPMTEFTQRYWIVFNGEIYNHAYLREELKKLGYVFATDHSDTEVILNAYACWGIDCLQKFNGMWAFCLWDSHTNVFFMARDRAGKKPLYYTTHNGALYFASELKSILANTSIPKTLSKHSIYNYLTYTAVPAPETIFNTIHKLPAAHYILYKPGEEISPKSYWTPFTNKPYFTDSERRITEGLREQIYEAARLRMVADVEVGVLLSGGLDSSISLACLNRYADKQIKSFSVGFENKPGYKNEFEFARKVARQFDSEYHELTVTESQFLDFIPEMVYYQDEPIADTANIPIYYIAKVARQNGVKVLLGGEGSDELFVGYKLWKMASDFAKVLEGRPIAASIAGLVHKNSPLRAKREYYYGWYQKVKHGQPVFWSGTELRSEAAKAKILSPDFVEELNGYTSFQPLEEFYKTYKSTTANADAYNWMLASDLRFRLPDFLLARLDRMLMAASVEGRNPFLDVNVIEYAMRIPPKMKVDTMGEKMVLKRAFEGILPDEIIYRDKDSFTVPIASLFANKGLKDMALNAINTMQSKTGFFSDDYITRVNANLIDQKEMWNISNLAIWYEKFC